MKDQKQNESKEKKSPQSGLRDDNQRAGEKGGKPSQSKGGQSRDKGTGQSSHR